jgi:hypothetical protein
MHDLRLRPRLRRDRMAALAQMVLSKTPGGNAVPPPTVSDALDLLRFDDLIERAGMGVNLWNALLLACQRGDVDIIRHHIAQIIILTRATNAVAKRLGNAQPDDAEGSRHG